MADGDIFGDLELVFTSTATGRTFLDLQNDALHDDFDPNKYRARVKVLLNEALTRVCRRVYGLQRRATNNIDVLAGINSYTLPNDFVRLVSLHDPALHPGALDEVDVEDIDDEPTATGAPAVFAIDAQNLVIWPTPANNSTLTLRYWATAPPLINDGDIPAIPNDYVDLLPTYTRAKLYRLEDDPQMHDALMAQFTSELTDAKADLQQTSLHRPRQVPSMWRPGARPRFVRPT